MEPVQSIPKQHAPTPPFSTPSLKIIKNNLSISTTSFFWGPAGAPYRNPTAHPTSHWCQCSPPQPTHRTAYGITYTTNVYNRDRAQHIHTLRPCANSSIIGRHKPTLGGNERTGKHSTHQLERISNKMNELERAVGKQQEELDRLQTLVEHKKRNSSATSTTTRNTNLQHNLQQTNILEHRFNLFSILYGCFFLS